MRLWKRFESLIPGFILFFGILAFPSVFADTCVSPSGSLELTIQPGDRGRIIDGQVELNGKASRVYDTAGWQNALPTPLLDRTAKQLQN
ncbi:MAG: hypothetical protein NDJ89_09780 [Oligoflexia bacterium]|nr:hypothetical protein [Oligoflexia bacterium]